jgi:hypothetical protein
MNNEATLAKMQKMKLYGMLKAFNQSLEAEAFVKKRGNRIRVSFMGHRYDDILQPIFSKIDHKCFILVQGVHSSRIIASVLDNTTAMSVL